MKWIPLPWNKTTNINKYQQISTNINKHQQISTIYKEHIPWYTFAHDFTTQLLMLALNAAASLKTVVFGRRKKKKGQM